MKWYFIPVHFSSLLTVSSTVARPSISLLLASFVPSVSEVKKSSALIHKTARWDIIWSLHTQFPIQRQIRVVQLYRKSITSASCLRRITTHSSQQCHAVDKLIPLDWLKSTLKWPDNSRPGKSSLFNSKAMGQFIWLMARLHEQDFYQNKPNFFCLLCLF